MTAKVLLIEDDPVDAEFLTKLLVSEGLGEPDWVTNLRDADAQLNGHSAVLLDLHLPPHIPEDTISWIKKRSPGLPILVVSGNDDPEMQVKVGYYGADAYLLKDGMTSGGLAAAVRCLKGKADRYSERNQTVTRRMGELRQLIGA